MPACARAFVLTAGLSAGLTTGLTTGLTGCGEQNLGSAPPEGQLFFPSGLHVDESANAPGEPARYLFVTNGNNDLRYNAGTLVAVNLDRFWGAWFDDNLQAGSAYCGANSAGVEQCIEPPGGPVSDDRPCRRLALKPQVVECDESPFISDEHIVHLGDFATDLAVSTETEGGNTFTRLWVPVRGDPSLTYVDVRASGGRVDLECNQGGDEDEPDERLCADDFRLRYDRNDEDLTELAREPFNMLISQVGDERLGFVAHAAGAQLTLVDLDGVRGRGRPAIVDQVNLFVAEGVARGGFGLAERPCFAAGEGPTGEDDPEANVPSITEACSRPLIYASYRGAPLVSSFTASGLVLPNSVADQVAESERTDCFVDAPTSCGGEIEGCDLAACSGGGSGCERIYAGQYCATPDQLGQPCAVVCEPQIRAERAFIPGALFPDRLPVLGDVAFADPRGDTLLALQTNPGALLFVDTSLAEDGEPKDIPASPPIEICDQPTRMVVYEDTAGQTEAGNGQRYALITCFGAALVYVVDLDTRRIIDNVVVGTGPHDLAVDATREVVYVANTLESSISVVDLSRTRPTRFQELARIGLQEPFER